MLSFSKGQIFHVAPWAKLGQSMWWRQPYFIWPWESFTFHVCLAFIFNHFPCIIRCKNIHCYSWAEKQLAISFLKAAVWETALWPLGRLLVHLCTILNFSTCLILFISMVSLADIYFISMEDMIKGETHGMNVSLMREDSHIFCSTCSKGNMRGGMATTTYLLTCGVSHELGNFIHPFYVY